MSAGFKHTKTMGARLKHARMSCGLTQQQLADGVRRITANAFGAKSSISQYEADKVVPGSSVLLAYVAITMFSQEWLLFGTGGEKAVLPVLRSSQQDTAARDALLKAVAIAYEVHRDSPGRLGTATVALYETLLDEPDVPRGALLRIARSAPHPA